MCPNYANLRLNTWKNPKRGKQLNMRSDFRLDLGLDVKDLRLDLRLDLKDLRLDLRLARNDLRLDVRDLRTSLLLNSVSKCSYIWNSEIQRFISICWISLFSVRKFSCKFPSPWMANRELLHLISVHTEAHVWSSQSNGWHYCYRNVHQKQCCYPGKAPWFQFYISFILFMSFQVLSICSLLLWISAFLKWNLMQFLTLL